MLLKIAYVGDKFLGVVRQPGLRTVEGDIVGVLETIGCPATVQVASRTDRGVSALGNVIQVECTRKDLCRILTCSLEDIWVYAWIEKDIPLRKCTKHYVYFLPGEYERSLVEDCCSLFSGTHDFRAFTKEKRRGEIAHTVRDIAVSYEVEEGMVLFHFTGRSFLWEMIRRIMTAVIRYMKGQWTAETIERLLVQPEKTDATIQGHNLGTCLKEKGRVPPAPAANLLLLDIEYGIPFSIDRFSKERMRIECSQYVEFFSVRKRIFEKMIAHEEK
jgi:tRNA pseudouridine38-40 synthase